MTECQATYCSHVILLSQSLSALLVCGIAVDPTACLPADRGGSIVQMQDASILLSDCGSFLQELAAADGDDEPLLRRALRAAALREAALQHTAVHSCRTANHKLPPTLMSAPVCQQLFTAADQRTDRCGGLSKTG